MIERQTWNTILLSALRSFRSYSPLRVVHQNYWTVVNCIWTKPNDTDQTRWPLFRSSTDKPRNSYGLVELRADELEYRSLTTNLTARFPRLMNAMRRRVELRKLDGIIQMIPSQMKSSLRENDGRTLDDVKEEFFVHLAHENSVVCPQPGTCSGVVCANVFILDDSTSIGTSPLIWISCACRIRQRTILVFSGFTWIVAYVLLHKISVHFVGGTLYYNWSTLWLAALQRNLCGFQLVRHVSPFSFSLH